MYEQYYYAVLYQISLISGYLLRAWYWWIFKVNVMPELYLMILGISLLILVLMHTIRNMKVVVIEGDEIHNLVKVINKEK